MRTLLTALVTVLVVACGNKGPLYLPDNPPETVAPADAAPATSDAAERKRREASS